jgi:hypothetical protein
MTRVLLLSDTHGHIDDKMIRYAESVDQIWHAGDIGDLNVTDTLKKIKPLRAVYGNIDGPEARTDFPLHNRFECEGMRVWITHIGGYPGNYNKSIVAELAQNTPQLFICGHSHILKVMPDKKLGLLHMNPGAAGIYGFHVVRTMLRFSIEKGKISNLEVIEIPKKT